MSESNPNLYKGYPGGHYPWIYPMPSEAERDKRWAAIRKSMTKHNIDCLIMGAPFGYIPLRSPLYYVSNYTPHFNSGTYVVFPLKGEPQLILPSDVGPQYQILADQVSWVKEMVMSPKPTLEIANKIKQLKLEKGRIGIACFEMGWFPASFYGILRENCPLAIFKDGTPLLDEAMDEVSRTSEEELALVKKACEILDLSFTAIAEALKPGVKEYELCAAAEQAIINNGGWHHHFMLSTSGPSPIFQRAPASHYALQKGDVVLFEFTCTYAGFEPQCAFALSIGHPKKEIERMFELCEELYHFSLAELGKKRTFADIEKDLFSRMHKVGYEPMTPQIHVYNISQHMPMDCPAQPGDYFVVHPNVRTKDFTAGAKFGNTVHIAKDGKAVSLQTTPPKLNIVMS
jgi:Xaa-Pro aminopeptidase